jgi:galactitol-specific phosphotransferase system IIC component
VPEGPFSERPGSDAGFYAAAERRIWRFQWIIGIAGTVIAGAWAGPGGALAYAAGAAISTLNFYWLQQAVDALTQTVLGAGTPAAKRRRRYLVAKFIGRYLLIGAAGYVILKHTAWRIEALLAGLFLFLAAILAEICVEIVIGVRSNSDGT